jgi:hypothetical protein
MGEQCKNVLEGREAWVPGIRWRMKEQGLRNQVGPTRASNPTNSWRTHTLRGWSFNFNEKKTPWPVVRKRTIPTEWPPLVDEVSAKFADRICRVVRATDPHGRYSRFSRPEPLCPWNGSSITLMRLSGPRSRPTTSQKIFIVWLTILASSSQNKVPG